MKTIKDHELIVCSLNDLVMNCKCGWSIVSTGEWTKKEAQKEYYKHIYNSFVYKWRKEHSISPAPSFTSWKRYYKNN